MENLFIKKGKFKNMTRNEILNLKNKIIEANKQYRIGNPCLTDQEYDNLCDLLHNNISNSEWDSFRSRLFERDGKVKHNFPMGSLTKFKYEEPKNVYEWINGHINKSLNISAKVDGISARLTYINGKLISATTRGNGYYGEDITDKIFFIKEVPQTINFKDEIDIRGELVIFTDVFEKQFTNKYSNSRNLTAGFINKKDIIPEELSNISFVAYTILGDKFTKSEQFKILEENKFFVAWHKSISNIKNKITDDFNSFNNQLRDYVKQNYPYGTDGIVLSDDDYRNENELIPDNQIAFKVNDSIFKTTVIDIEWGEPSKNGRMSPVIIVEPIEINGSIISRCTGNNLDYLEKMDIRFGSIVQIIKSGEVIPKIISVVDNPKNSVKITHPNICPICGTKLVVDGVDLCCPNEFCSSKQISSVNSFIKKFDVKHSAKKQLDNFKIKTINDLISFLPNKKYKSEVKFYNEINEKIFTSSPKKIFCAMNFKGLAEIQLNKIVDQYTFNWIFNLKYTIEEKTKMLSNLPNGIGEKSLETFWNSLPDAIENTKKIINDSRYNYNLNNIDNSAKKSSDKTLGSICFTGTLETMGRKEAQSLAESVGFEVKNNVNKGLTYLVIADPNSNSSKAKKAREFGTKLLSEKDFIALCKGEEQDLNDL